MIDFYTKSVLTVIAISLLVLAATPWIREARVTVDAPGVESSLTGISTEISFSQPSGRSRPAPTYEKPELSAWEKALLDRLPDKPKK